MNTSKRYSGIGDPARWSLVEALVEQGNRQPDALCYQDTLGDKLTFGASLADVRRVAG